MPCDNPRARQGRRHRLSEPITQFRGVYGFGEHAWEPRVRVVVGNGPPRWGWDEGSGESRRAEPKPRPPGSLLPVLLQVGQNGRHVSTDSLLQQSKRKVAAAAENSPHALAA